MRLLLGKIAAIAVLASVTSFTFANLLTNGSFENGSYTWDGNHADSLAIGSTVIAGWTTVTGEIASLEIGNPFGLASTDGGIFLDLTGYHDSNPYGGVQQTISTVANQTYTLTFLIGLDNANGNYSGPVVVSADINGNLTNFTNSATGTGNQWVQAVDTFTATSTSTTITLSGISSAGGQYVGLDSADVEATPEPMTVGLLGFGALALIVRKRRAAR